MTHNATTSLWLVLLKVISNRPCKLGRGLENYPYMKTKKSRSSIILGQRILDWLHFDVNINNSAF